MAVTLVATAGSTSANSYISVADADAYFNNRLNSTNWESADPDDKSRALVMATDRIEQEKFQGRKVDSGQRLQWPRYEVYDKNDDLYATDAIPRPVQNATCELAILLLGSDYLKESKLSQFNAIRVGPIALDIRQPVSSGKLPAAVLRELRGVLLTAGAEIVRA